MYTCWEKVFCTIASLLKKLTSEHCTVAIKEKENKTAMELSVHLLLLENMCQRI